MPDWLNSIATSTLSRLIQDMLTGLAASLVADGVITQSQQAGFVGSMFFLAMLVVNFALHKIHANAAYNSGVTDGMISMAATPAQTVKGPNP